MVEFEERLRDIFNPSLPIKIKKKFISFLKNQNFPNLFIHGPYGVGKSTLIKSFLKKFLHEEEDFSDVLEINGSDENSVGFIRSHLKGFLKFPPIPPNPFRVIFIDEAENLTPQAQTSLRKMMDTYTSNRFIFILNDLSRFQEALISRCDEINLDGIDSALLKKELIADYPEDRVDSALAKHYPDVRKILLELRWEEVGPPNQEILELVKKVKEICSQGSYVKANSTLCEGLIARKISLENFFVFFLKELDSFGFSREKNRRVLEAVIKTFELSKMRVPFKLLFIYFVLSLSNEDDS